MPARTPAPLPRDTAALAREVRAAALAMVRLHFRLGQMVVRLRRTRTYGEAGVPALAHATGLAESTLYRFAHVAMTWSDEEFDEIITGRTAPALSWSHLTELCRVPSRAMRARLTKEARAGELSSREVKRRVTKALGKGR